MGGPEVFAPQRGERIAVGSGDADRGRAADREPADRLGDLGGRPAAQLDLLVGQPPLVEQDDSVPLEPDDLRRLEGSHQSHALPPAAGAGLSPAGGQARLLP